MTSNKLTAAQLAQASGSAMRWQRVSIRPPDVPNHDRCIAEAGGDLVAVRAE